MIDTHLHLLYPDRFSYSWTRAYPALAKAFTLEDYRREAEGCGIRGSLFMEVDVDAEDKIGETAFFSELSEQPDSGVVGVIGGLDPERSTFREEVAACRSPALKGIRRVMHTQPDRILQEETVRKNLQWLGSAGLSFDLCVKQSQLPLAVELVRACPDTLFILDHCGSPEVLEDPQANQLKFQEWQTCMQTLASPANVRVKFSGLSTYVPEACRKPERLQPYVDSLLEAFGVDRMVWGSDWPVVNLGEGLAAWCQRSRELLSGLDALQRKRIFEDNAITIYRVKT